MSNEKAMREASIGKLLLTMSLPVILVMLVQVLYNMADVFFLGRTGDPMQVAAVSLAAPVFSVFSAFNTLIGFGGCTAMSLALGRGDKERVRKYSAFVLYAGLLIGLVVGAGTLIFMDPLLKALGTNAETAAFTSQYIRIMAVGAPFAIAGGALSNAVRADGDSKGAVVATMAGTLLNVVLDPVLISLLKMGVVGAGLATVAGNVASFLILMVLLGKKETFSISLKDFTLAPKVSLKLLSLGLPMAAGTMLMSFSSLFSNRLMLSYGNQAIAANGVAGKAGMLVGMILMGIAMGMQPAISFLYGAGENKRLKKVLLGTGACCVVTAAVLGSLCLLGREAFVGAFLAEEKIVELGQKMVVGSLIAAPLSGIYQLCSVYLQATGKVSYATITALMQKGLVFVPVLYLMNACFGLSGLIFAGAVTDVISTAAALLLCRDWSKKQRINAGQPAVA